MRGRRERRGGGVFWGKGSGFGSTIITHNMTILAYDNIARRIEPGVFHTAVLLLCLRDKIGQRKRYANHFGKFI